MKPMLIAPLALTALLGACANSGANVEPILDGSPNARYESDLAACRALARSQSQLDHETMAAAALGAGAGGDAGARLRLSYPPCALLWLCSLAASGAKVGCMGAWRGRLKISEAF